MIHVIVTIELSAGRRDDFLAEFRRIVSTVREEEGCIEYGPAVDLETSISVQPPLRDNVVTVVEKWESLAALEAHLIAPHMLEYRAKVKDLVQQATVHILKPV